MALTLALLPTVTPAHEIDGVEHLLGATRINGIVGNGGLTVGISKEGEITVFRYPSPSYYDQLDYKTAIVPVEAGYHARDLDYFGASADQGAFAGVYKENKLIWLRDIDNIKQEYLSDDSAVLQTIYKLDGATYEIRDFVHPSTDVFVRHTIVKGGNGNVLLHYQNFAPMMYKRPMLPVEDWEDDSRNDFAAFFFHPVIVHFVPYHTSKEEVYNNYSKLLELIEFSPKDSDILLSHIIPYASNVTGIFIAVGLLDDQDISFQVGYDGRCGGGRDEPPFKPVSAFEDAQDGVLNGDHFALCSANSMISTEITSEEFEVSFAFAVSDTLAGALSTLQWAREVGFKKLFEDTEEFWRGFLNSASFPQGLTEREKAFCKRTLISIKECADRDTGAIVASISTQPPYSEDWPRDGAFINLLLDIFGFKDMVTKRNIFLTKVQRKGGVWPGSFDMNFYADGMVGGLIKFEIDEVGFALYSFWTHAKFLDGQERDEYIDKVYPSIKLAAELLIDCVDEETGLQCPANEDDNPEFTVTLIGASTVYMGLRNALEAAEYMVDKEMSAKIRKRLYELREAIWDNFWTGEFLSGHPKGTSEFEELSFEIGSMSYIIWPAMFFEDTNSDYLKSHALSLLSAIKPHFNKETSGIVYLGKALIPLARFFGDDKEFKNQLDSFLSVLMNEVPTSTLHVGEVAVLLPDGRFENRVAIPHPWEASLNCLSAVAIRDPDAFNKADLGINGKPVVVFPQEEKIRACACSTSVLNFALFVSLFVLWRRRFS
jgi:GH15 family glucan-1,4-alpha-glucosidase